MPKGQQNNNKPRIDRSIEKIPIVRENQTPGITANKQAGSSRKSGNDKASS